VAEVTAGGAALSKPSIIKAVHYEVILERSSARRNTVSTVLQYRASGDVTQKLTRATAPR